MPSVQENPQADYIYFNLHRSQAGSTSRGVSETNTILLERIFPRSRSGVLALAHSEFIDVRCETKVS